MIQIFDTKPCTDNQDHVQVEGLFVEKEFSVSAFDILLKRIGFFTVSIGEPKALICKRSDCFLLINADGSFNLSQVQSQNELLKIINEIKLLMHG